MIKRENLSEAENERKTENSDIGMEKAFHTMSDSVYSSSAPVRMYQQTGRGRENQGYSVYGDE